jgi:hypothetical protein
MTVPAMVFESEKSESLRVYYGAANAPPPMPVSFTANMDALLADPAVVKLGPERRPAPSPVAMEKHRPDPPRTVGIGRIIGITMLLLGLLLLLSIILRSRSLRKSKEDRHYRLGSRDY